MNVKHHTNHLISWQQALEIIRQTDTKGVPAPFSVIFCTANQTTGTGGEIISYEKAVWHVKGGRVTAKDEVPSLKKPNHDRHATLNIRGLESDQIRKIHLHLILTINGLSIR